MLRRSQENLLEPKIFFNFFFRVQITGLRSFTFTKSLLFPVFTINLTEHIPPLLCEIFTLKKIQPKQVVPLIRALTVVLFDTTQTVCHQAEIDLTTFLFFSAASSDAQAESK